MLNHILLRNEIKEHIRRLKSLKARAESNNKPHEQDIVEYTQITEFSSSFFSNTDVDSLLENYLKIVQELSQNLCNNMFSLEQKLLNMLEYSRFCCMYDNLIAPTEDLVNIGYTGLNAAILGKGVCSSQAKLLRDVFNYSGIPSKIKNINLNRTAVEGPSQKPPHSVTLVHKKSGRYSFIDPTWYKGTLASLAGCSSSCEDSHHFDLLHASQEDIEQSRNAVSSYLVKKFQIDKLSKDLNINKMSDLDKQIFIIYLIEKFILPSEQNLQIRTVNISGIEVETGKLIELFFFANNIPYSISACKSSKINTILKTTLYNETCYLDTSKLYDLKTGQVTENLHTLDSSTQLYTYSPEILNAYKSAIETAKQLVDKIPDSTNIMNASTSFLDSLKIGNVDSPIFQNNTRIDKKQNNLSSLNTEKSNEFLL